jgi:hypothetical protein
LKKDFHLKFLKCINSKTKTSEISWLLGGLASGVDFESKDPGFNTQTAQKSE